MNPSDVAGRVEKKYAVSEELARRVLEWSCEFLRPDRGLGGQRVTTLYLDTPSLTFYQWQLDRQFERFKLRIRGYGEPPIETVYAEIKRKCGDLVRKDRAEVSLAMLSAVAADPRVEGVAPFAVLDFLKIVSFFGAGPTVVVSGLRNALRENTSDGELAVTVDRHLVCQNTGNYDFTGDPHTWKPLVLPKRAAAIVELKHVDEPPAWMVELMAELAPNRVRFSKYSAAIQQQVIREENLPIVA